MIKIAEIGFYSLVVIVISFSLSFAGQKGVVAQGDGITVTETEVMAMQGYADNQNFRPSRRALVKATVKTILFAEEALKRGMDCPGAAEKEAFDRTVLLAGCYLKTRLAEEDLIPGAVESFYRVNWRSFWDEDKGDLLKLDADLKKRIEERIRAARKGIFIRQEYKRLCKKYNVVLFINGS